MSVEIYPVRDQHDDECCGPDSLCSDCISTAAEDVTAA